MKQVETYAPPKENGKIMLNANELYCDLDEALRKEVLHELNKLSFHRYPDETSKELIEAYAKVMELDAACILAGNGSDEMLGFLIQYFLGKDKKLYTLQPDFSMYDYYAGMQETQVVKFVTDADGRFDVDAFIEQGREQRVDMILFSNPNNPSGHALSNQELLKIVDAFPCIPVVIDEAYAEFAHDSMLKETSNYTNLYVTRTLSKAYGLAGVRLGFLIGNKAMMQTLRPHIVPYNISSVDQKIGAVVLRHASRYQPLIQSICEERDKLYQALANLQTITFYPSQANYLYGRSQRKQAMLKRLQEHGIVIRNYANDDSFRITIGSKEENACIKDLLVAFDKEDTYEIG